MSRHPLLRVLAGLVCVSSLLVGVRTTVVTIERDSDDARVQRQLTFLHSAIAAGAARDMQALFPEGEFFTLVLTGLAHAQSGHPDRALPLYEASGRPSVADRFGRIPALEHGTFYRGWRLLLAAAIADAGGTDPASLQSEADAIEAALLADPDGVPESYPGGRWPCDAVVAMAAVVRAHTLVGRRTAGLNSWLTRVEALRDPGVHLLPHRLGATSNEPPRGSSQSIIQGFWPDVSPDPAADWSTFRATFVVREAGLVGVREHPLGTHGTGDVDSGPLVLGVSPSASAVTLAAARANGDASLASDLDREAELLGLPLDLPAGRRFALGALPVGDAWVAWARTVRHPDTLTSHDDRALLWAWAAATLTVAAASGWLALGGRRRPRRP